MTSYEVERHHCRKKQITLCRLCWLYSIVGARPLPLSSLPRCPTPCIPENALCDECGFRRERAIYGNRGPPRLWASAHHRRFVLDFLLFKQMMVGIGAHCLSTVFCPVLLKSHGPHLFVWWLRHILCVSLSCLCRPRFVWTCVVVDLSWTSLVVYKLMLRPCLCFPAHRQSFP